MSKLYIFLVFYVFTNSIFASNDTTKIVFFQDSNIQQYRGVEWHRIKKAIPKGKYQKAILKIDLGCATYGCCAWDYTYRGFFEGGHIQNDSHRIEVARLITPYSSFMRKNRQGYDSLWSHPYIYDLTDYLPLLKDSLTYSALTGGYDDKGKFGFKHTVTLYLIKGENPRSTQNIISAYGNEKGYKYKDSIQFDSSLSPIKFNLDPKVKHAKFRMIFTGHEQQGEFSPIPFYLVVNGQNAYFKRLWKTDCDRNAIQPQSGTWIFSRCNWCPGEKIEEIEADMSPYLIAGENSIDIQLGKIETQDTVVNASYFIEGHIITYDSLPMYDAEIVDIVSPNLDPRFKHENPICHQARVKVKNVGSKLITALHFEYQTTLGAFHKHSWFGSLSPNEIINIELPMNWGGLDFASSKFHVKLISSLQNRVKTNDAKISSFHQVKTFKTDKIDLNITMTNDSSIDTLVLYRDSSEVLRKYYYNDNQSHKESLTLPDGNYRLLLIDRDKNFECGDGLSFWFSSRIYKKTSGNFRINDSKSGELLKVFNPDFGSRIDYQFRISK